jgi:hypothetical protein
MTHELSLVELETELSAELPERSLMRRKRHQAWGWFPHASASASASYGSASNANATYQVNFNPQIVINNGTVGGAGISVDSHNRNNNTATQNALPINFGIA